CRRRLINDAQYVQACNAARVFGRLALAIIEVSGDRDHRFSYFFAEIIFGRLFHLLQDECRDLRGAVALAADFHPSVAILIANNLIREKTGRFLHHGVVTASPNQTFNRGNCVFRICNCLPAGDLSDQSLPLSVKATTDGVVRLPSALARTLGSPPSIIATHELVVPKSIPITFAILNNSSKLLSKT